MLIHATDQYYAIYDKLFPTIQQYSNESSS